MMTEREDDAPAGSGGPGGDGARILDRVAALGADLARVRAAIGTVIFGQEEVVERVLTALLAGGHALLVGVPGLGKTLLVQTIGTVLGLQAGRIQFTPDLMPADITGGEVLEQDESGQRHFRFLPGPVFCQLLMADEINRASPRTQSALLQAMQEGRVSAGGIEHGLPLPFHVLATQNPIEQEGTYPLPEAQLDRFLLEIRVPYPDEAAERAILLATSGLPRPAVDAVLDAQSWRAAQALIRHVPVGEQVLGAVLALVRGARPESAADPALAAQIAWGPGPRAAQALLLAARARAILQGRLAPDLGDVAALAVPALRHRMALTYAARAEGMRAENVIAQLVGRLG